MKLLVFVITSLLLAAPASASLQAQSSQKIQEALSFQSFLNSNYPDIQLSLKTNPQNSTQAQSVLNELQSLENILQNDQPEPQQQAFEHLACCKIVCGGCAMAPDAVDEFSEIH